MSTQDLILILTHLKDVVPDASGRINDKIQELLNYQAEQRELAKEGA